MSLPPKSDNDDVLPAAGETKPRARKTTRAAAGVKRVRTRKTKAEKSESEEVSGQSQDTGDLFSGSVAHEAPAAEPTRRSRSESAAETRHEAPASSQEQPAARHERHEEPVREVRQPAPEAPRVDVRAEPAPALQPAREQAPESAPAERPVFVPTRRDDAPAPASEGSESAAPEASSSSEGQQAPSGEPQQGEGDSRQGQGGDNAPDQQRSQGGGGGDGRPVVKDRNYWKQLKKDKKKWKQEQRQHGGGGGGHGGHGGQRQHGGGGQGQHGGHVAHEKPAPQPPPPAFVQNFGDLPNPARFEDLAALDAQAAEISSLAQGDVVHLEQLFDGTIAELTAFARVLNVNLEGAPPPRGVLLGRIIDAAWASKRKIVDRGWLDLTDKGHGFIVHSLVNYRLYPENTYVPEALVRRFGLKRGHEIEVMVTPPQGDERCCSAIRIDSAMGKDPGLLANITPFEELTPYYPLNRILVEAPEVHVKDVSMRAVDILTPIGFGQRGLIVAPPRTGKTVLLHNIANSISENYPDAKLIVLLVDERPEEVTDFRRHTKGEVVSSTFDEMPENHVHAAEMVSEKAKRLVEQGQHVIILLDSITRLARAYNALASNSGKIMSGGIEATALQRPKRFFGAARNIEGAGSLTILGTALIDTGSRMDEVIFEEFKGTGNMELHLDRGLSDKRIFPAVNIDRSGTRKEELIYHPEELQRIYGLRRAMQGLGPIESMDMLIQRLKKTKTNAEFLIGLSRT